MGKRRRVSGVPEWGHRHRLRVGLLGGSFNPAHAGHRHVAELALRRLRLDQVWLLVSPGNPLKGPLGMGRPGERLRSAQAIADGRRVVATDIERALGTRYTLDTVRGLQRRFPRVRFVWLMGADNLAQLPRWRGWMALARAVPFAVLPRPTYNQAALAGQAARRLRGAQVGARAASGLVERRAPAWVFLPAPQNPASATALRRQSPGWQGKAPSVTPGARGAVEPELPAAAAYRQVRSAVYHAREPTP